MFRRTRQTERTGDWSAFEAEAMPLMPDLFRLAMWLVRERAGAEDLVQETFAQALQSFHRFEKGTNCRAWLVTIMYHMNSKRRRAMSLLQLVHDSEERIAETVAYEAPTPQGLTEEEVLRALRRLPPQYQEVVVLADVEDLAYQEIADAMAIPVGTVMSRLHRGRKMLRAELAGYANAHGIGSARIDQESSSSLTGRQRGGESDAVS